MIWFAVAAIVCGAVAVVLTVAVLRRLALGGTR